MLDTTRRILFPGFVIYLMSKTDPVHHLFFSYLLLLRIYDKLTLLEKVRFRQLYNEQTVRFCSFFNNGTKKETF